MVLTVRDIMVADPVVLPPDARGGDAARLMLEHRISSIVVGRGDRAEGIVTPRDLMRDLSAAADAKLADLMTAAPTTIDAAEPMDRAIQLMDEGHIRHLPVTEQGRLVGMVSVRDIMQHRARYLEGIVHQQTADLETKNQALEVRDRHMNYHLQLAGRIQRHLLPQKLPQLDPLSVAVHYEAHSHVSGDWYDLVPLTEDRVGILIADACGHGVPAAFISVMARAVFQASGRKARSPAAVLRMMNDELPELIRDEHFLTMCYAVVDRRTCEVTYAMAGHPPPLWYRHDTQNVEPLEGIGDLVGVIPDPSFDERHIRLAPKDALLFYTDGVIEARDPKDQLFGRQRAASSMLDVAPAPSLALAGALDQKLRTFCGGRDRDDDATWIVLSVDGSA